MLKSAIDLIKNTLTGISDQKPDPGQENKAALINAETPKDQPAGIQAGIEDLLKNRYGLQMSGSITSNLV